MMGLTLEERERRLARFCADPAQELKASECYGYTPYRLKSETERAQCLSDAQKMLDRAKKRYGITGFAPLHEVDNPQRPPVYNMHGEFLFLGKDGETVWSMFLESPQNRAWREAASMAAAKCRSLLTLDELEREYDLEEWDRDPEAWKENLFCWQEEEDGCVSIVENDGPRHESLGGLTCEEYRQREEARILAAGEVVLREEFVVNDDYEWCMRVVAVVSDPVIDSKAMQRALERFRALGETGWQSESDIDQALIPRLPELEHLRLFFENNPQYQQYR